MLDEAERSEDEHPHQPEDAERRRGGTRERAVDEAQRDRDLHHPENAAEEIDGQLEIRNEQLSTHAAHEQRDAHVNADDERHPRKEPDVVVPRHPECDGPRHDASPALRAVDRRRDQRDSNGDRYRCQATR